ncbi:MAG: sortase [Pseudomonadales bacterium]|nr:sortase [Pseudomonadales bacterium]
MKQLIPNKHQPVVIFDARDKKNLQSSIQVVPDTTLDHKEKVTEFSVARLDLLSSALTGNGLTNQVRSKSKHSGVFKKEQHIAHSDSIPTNSNESAQTPLLKVTELDTQTHQGRWQMHAGKLMMAAAICFFVFFFAPILSLEMKSLLNRAHRDENIQTYQVQNGATALSQLVETQKEELVVPDEEERFSLEIPAIQLKSDVIANVSMDNETEYTSALSQGVAHAKGTGLPGEDSANKTIFIFGHSTNETWNIQRYNALFYDIKLLKPGDPIYVWFWGKKTTYIVKETTVVDPTDTSFLQPQNEKEQLVLQTCWPPGTTESRLLVFAEPQPASDQPSTTQITSL